MRLISVGLIVAATAALATACEGPVGRGANPPGRAIGGTFWSSLEPTGDGLSAAFRRPIAEGDLQRVLAEHLRGGLYAAESDATRRKFACAPAGPCAAKIALLQVDATGKPAGTPPSCSQISVVVDRDARGQSTVRSLTWDQRAGACKGA